MADDTVLLTIGGKRFGGWKEIAIDVGLDTVASGFTFAVTERWPGQSDRWTIDADAPVVVTIGGETVITGFVDRLTSALDDGSHSVSVTGRSKAADLIDCSAIHTPGSWSGRTLEAIAAELAKPFGISVSAKASTAPPFKKFALQPGESVWEAIERMLRFRGLLAVSTADGNIEIVSPAPGGAAIRLVQGKHLYSVSGSHDVTERFSDYLVKGQAAGDDEANGATVTGPKGVARDPGVKRHRPLLLVAEEQSSIAALTKRAQWEATVRAAQAQEATVTLPGWRNPDGDLWRHGQTVALDAPAAWMTADLLVASVSYRLDAGGRSAALRVVRPEAYSQLPVPEEAEASKIRKKAA